MRYTVTKSQRGFRGQWFTYEEPFGEWTTKSDAMEQAKRLVAEARAASIGGTMFSVRCNGHTIWEGKA